MIIALLWIIFFLLSVKLQLENDLSTKGQDYQSLLDQVSKTRAENNLLDTEILYNTSLTVLSRKAAALGFIPATEKNYVFLQRR